MQSEDEWAVAHAAALSDCGEFFVESDTKKIRQSAAELRRCQLLSPRESVEVARRMWAPVKDPEPEFR